ncbi:helix-turn-helix transcriptional regulator [Streptomyces hokutonensis]|uniref:helix-turn-helix transcriptional regulator n=1 Tax=Streptomyces hokutonensis TaxID=1306990 RepID=UPI00340EBD8F
MGVLTALFDDAEAGRSGAIVLRGEAGIGKTVLLETVSELAAGRGMATVAVSGVEEEAPLGYAALHRFLRLFPGSVDALPPPQRDALRVTLGLVAGPPPDRFLVGLGLLTLLADGAADAPLVMVIDDAQWLDPESGTVLGFSAHRLQAERVVMVFAAREVDEGLPWLRTLPELRIGRLNRSHAAELLSSATSGFVSPGVEARLLDAGGGNPLALVEVARQLTPEQMAGADVLPDPLPAGGSPNQLFTRRLEGLTRSARLLLAAAAAEPTATKRLVSTVTRRLGAHPDDFAGLDDLVSFGDIVQFRHPLVRSVAYYGVPSSERRRIHRELAHAMDSPQHADRVVWHLAMAATGPDERVASRLEQAAHRMRARGAYAATAVLLQRAADLSVGEHLRTDRLLAASEAALVAARPDQARAMLAEARGPADARQAASARRLSGQALFAVGATDDAARELLAAAKALMTLDPALARQTLLQALIASQFGTSAVFEEVRSFTTTITEADLAPGGPLGVVDLFLFGFLRRFAGDAEEAARLLRRAVSELERSERSDELRVAIPPMVPALAGTELIDDRVAAVTAHSYAEFARQAGALTVLPNALIVLARVAIIRGRFEDTELALTEADQLARATGAPGTPDFGASQRIFLLCWRGDEVQAAAQAAVLEAAGRRPSPGGDLVAGHLALLDLSKGRYQDAFDRLVPIVDEDRLSLGTMMLADFVEAAARSGRYAEATAALDRLTARAVAGAVGLGLGRLARCRAFLADDDQAEAHYRASIEALADADAPTELARSRLVYGEWLRRRRRRRDARSELNAAYDMFAGMGAHGFAERARIELSATGASVRKRTAEAAGSPSLTSLTAQEKQIASLVADGYTNSEVAAKLFISPATVDHHLRKTYQKLGVSSRTQMARVLGQLT